MLVIDIIDISAEKITTDTNHFILGSNTMSNTTSNIKTAVTNSLMKVKLTADALANCPDFKITSSTNSVNENIYDNVFCISVLSHKFIASDGNIAADHAELRFNIALHGCEFSSQQGWLWDSENGYTLKSDEDNSPSLTVYNDGFALDSGDKDSKTSDILANHIINSTPSHRLIDAFKHILVRVEDPK